MGKDRRTLRLFAIELHDTPIDLWTQFQFVLVVFDLNDTYIAAQELARDVAKTAPHRRMICVVGTKRDVIPQDYSDLDLSIRSYSSYFACYMDLQYFSASSITQNGIDDVLYFIGIVEFLSLSFLFSCIPQQHRYIHLFDIIRTSPYSTRREHGFLTLLPQCFLSACQHMLTSRFSSPQFSLGSMSSNHEY